MGTVFQVPWTRIDPWPGGLEVLRDSGFTVAALALTDDAVSLDELAAEPPERLALVLRRRGRRPVAAHDRRRPTSSCGSRWPGESTR